MEFNFGLFWEQARIACERTCIHYQQSSPIVSKWADKLYIDLAEHMTCVDLLDLRTLDRLNDGGQWVNANLAQNIVYKRLEEQGLAEGVISF